MKLSRIRKMIRDRREREKVYSRPEYWDSRAAEEQGLAVSMWPNNNLNSYYHREQLSAIERLLPDVRGTRALDVGCGTGRMSRYLADRGARVLGIDFSAKAIEIARRMSPPPNPEYRVESMFDIECSRSFDLAVSWCSIALACRDREELGKALDSIKGAVKSGGRILFCEPIHEGFLHRVLSMDLSGFRDALTDRGFSVLEVTQLHFWPMRLALASIPWPKPVTAAGYYAGQWIMSLAQNRAFGDYKMIYASAK